MRTTGASPVRLLRRRLWALEDAFPPHRLSLGWALVLLVAPLPLLAAVRHDALLASLAFTSWLFFSVGLATASLVDFARSPQGARHRGLRLARQITRLAIATVGGVVAIVGLVLAVQAIRLSAAGGSRGGLLVLWLTAVVIGVQFMLLPFRRSP